MDLPNLLVVFAITYFFGMCQTLTIVKRCIAPVCARPQPNCRYQADADGCPTCNLICNPVTCPTLNCPQTCYNGHVKDENGCNTCTCTPGCYKRTCPADCPFGTYMDGAGCPTCQCKPQPLACHSEVAPYCNKGVCPNACACKPFCYPSPNDGMSRTGNTVDDFWDLLFAKQGIAPQPGLISEAPLSFFFR